MNKEQVEMLGEYIKAGKSNILIEEIPESVIERGAIVIEANCSNADLMGHYENDKFQAPEWYKKLIETKSPILVIKNINLIPEEEQRKFIELFKYKKMYVHKLPENCMIFATYNNLDEKPIEEELYSFMIHI